MGERLLCKQEVVGSIPSGSTKRFISGREYVIVHRSGEHILIDIVKRRFGWLHAFVAVGCLVMRYFIVCVQAFMSTGLTARHQSNLVKLVYA